MKSKEFSQKGFKVLSVAALAGLTSMGVAQAETTTTPTPTLGENSAYTLTKVDAAGTNTITKYSYNNETGLTEAINYEVGLKQTTYGTGDASKTFNVNLINAPVTITTNYNTNVTTKYENNNYDYGTITNPSSGISSAG